MLSLKQFLNEGPQERQPSQNKIPGTGNSLGEAGENELSHLNAPTNFSSFSDKLRMVAKKLASESNPDPKLIAIVIKMMEQAATLLQK